ncbi:MAG: A24 family peptidase [Candidatus Pacearchaeota archaeon]|jgi:Flp pilus assembly protein protease CpaA
MNEVMFLICLAFLWISFASFQDLKKREVANWLSFSLVIFALGYRFFYSLFFENFNFLLQGLIGLGIFFLIGNLFYYSRMFAGGDAKLMIALGAVLPFSENLIINLEIFLFFIVAFLIVGGIYGIIISLVLGLRNFKNFKCEYKNLFNKKKKLIYSAMIFGLVLMIFGFSQNMFFILGIIIFIFPYFYVYAKAVDEACMVRKVKTKSLTEGDWLYQNVKVGNKLIKAKWEGLGKKEINLIQKNKKEILIRQGIPFVPVFWFSFLILVYVYFFKKFSLILF